MRIGCLFRMMCATGFEGEDECMRSWWLMQDQWCYVLQVQSILKPIQGVSWPSGKPENEGGYGAIFLQE